MYTSLDLHKKYAQAVVMNEAGAVLKEERIEKEIKQATPFKVVLFHLRNVLTKSPIFDSMTSETARSTNWFM
jgi:hypothetical protein